MKLRDAIPADVDALVALVETAYRGEASRAGWTTEADLLDGQRTDAEAVRAVLSDVVVAVEAGQILGCCALTPREGHAYFGMFAVRPGLQGSGLGSELLAEAERRARELGVAYVEMTVVAQRKELIEFYLRRGYVDTGETRPFPYGDERFGRPKREDLQFAVLVKHLTPTS